LRVFSEKAGKTNGRRIAGFPTVISICVVLGSGRGSVTDRLMFAIEVPSAKRYTGENAWASPTRRIMLMKTICLHSRKQIEAFLRKNVYLHIYAIGDLDDFFWQHTAYYALKDGNEIQAIVLLYAELPLPTVHAISEQEGVMQELLRSIFHILPSSFNAHLSPGVEQVFKEQHDIRPYGKHYKMALKNEPFMYDVDCSQVVRLTQNDLDEIFRLYKAGYPGNWFDPRMLETKQYFGIRLENRLVSIAGIHVYSEEYGVAALGNIVTHPDYRGNGFAKSVTARLCQSLSSSVDHIGLNVKADNAIAISLYEKLGFEVVSPYYECMVSGR
jgi:ribosomal protein S18 acetylase RimI-like enzyme